MRRPIWKTHPVLKIISGALIDLPASNLFIWWNVGSLLGLCLRIQIATGLFLAMHYTAYVTTALVTNEKTNIQKHEQLGRGKGGGGEENKEHEITEGEIWLTRQWGHTSSVLWTT